MDLSEEFGPVEPARSAPGSLRSPLRVRKPNAYDAAVGGRLRSFRRIRCSSVTDFAEALDLHPMTYEMIEAGAVGISGSAAMRLLDAFGLDPAWLLAGRLMLKSANDNQDQ